MKKPPNNTDAEAALLSMFMIDEGGALFNEAISEGMAADWFYDTRHQSVFSAAKDLHREDKPPIEINLIEKLKASGELNKIGGAPAVYELSRKAEVTAHYRSYLDIVREKYFRRRTLFLGSALAEKAVDPESDSTTLLDKIEREVFELRTGRSGNTVRTAGDLVAEVEKNIEFLTKNRGSIIGLPTGIEDLDSVTRGFMPGQMIVVAARPGMGKTSIALNFVEAALFSPKVRSGQSRRTLVFSLEMPPSELMQRLAASRANVSWRKIQDGFASKDMLVHVRHAMGEFAQAPLLIDAAGGKNILEIRAIARREHAREPLGLMVIDYLQLLAGTDGKQPREQQIAEASRTVKAMATEFGCAVVALAQLNREAEKEGRHPALHDLRESGAIEQDADIVLFISRDKPKEKDEPESQMIPRKLIVAKQRSGPVGDYTVHFNRSLTKFTSPA